MALQDIAQVSISLNTSGVSRAGFGVPMFITAHNYYKDRIRSYTTATDVATDMTTESNGYSAAVSTFSNTPSVSTLKVGRLIASSAFSPRTAEDGTVTVGVVYTITVTDESDSEVAASYTTITNDTLSDIVTNLVSQINAGGLNVTLTNEGDSFQISRAAPYPANDFVLSDISNLDVSAVQDLNSEGILDCLTEISEIDNDWYALSWEDHTTLSDILSVADYVESVEKLYFVGSAATSSINEPFTLGDEPTSGDDVLAYLADGGYLRTVGWYHQDADTDFNELAFAGYNLPFDAGSVVWANIQVPTSNAKNDEGNSLTTTQQQNLADRYSNWAAVKGGIVYTREGKVIGNEWIDNIRGRDNLQADLEADLFDLLTNQQGQKLPYTDKGINVVAGVVESRLNDYKVNRNFLTDPITINVPKAKDISREDKVTRILNDMSFKAKLAGAIIMVDLTGTLEV